MASFKQKMFFCKNIIFLLKTFNGSKLKLFSILIFILIFITSIIPLYNIILTSRLLNIIQLDLNIKKVINVILLITGVQIIHLFLTSINNFLTNLFQLKLNNYVTQLIMRKTGSISLPLLFSNENIDLLHFLRTNSTTKLGSLFTYTTTIFSSIVTFIFTFSYLFSYIPLYTVLVVLSSIPIAYTQIYYNKRNFELSRKLNKINRKQFYLSFISTTPDYLKEIVQHFSMGFIISSYKNLFNKIYKPTKFLTRKIMIANILVSLIGVITIAYAQYKTILLVFGGSILIGTLMSIIQSLGMIFQRVQNLLLSFGGFHNDLLYINNLREFLETQEVEGESENESSFNAVKLVAENLCYKVGDRTIIENINFEFKSNTIIGIKGSNGVGKSTLIDIIQGIKKQTSGDLFINGINSSEITEKKRLHLCQTLRQNPPRYEFTLNDNIAISDYKKLSKGNVVEHINSYDPDSFIFNKDIDIKTMLGEWYENSKQLSGGQWQLIGLFRLLYRTSPVYLLDEPTNNLDSKSIQLLKKIIAKASKKSLIIIVSHDESFLEDICTRIYNMKWNELSLVKDLEKELVTSK